MSTQRVDDRRSILHVQSDASVTAALNQTWVAKFEGDLAEDVAFERGLLGKEILILLVIAFLLLLRWLLLGVL